MSSEHSKTDVILIGGGIMSATLGTLLKELSPDKEIKIFEKLEQNNFRFGAWSPPLPFFNFFALMWR